MAGDNKTKQVVEWFHELDISLTKERQKLEWLCNSHKNLLSMQGKRLQIKDQDVNVNPVASVVPLQPEEKEDIIDFDEIDKLLEKAKFLRVQAEETGPLEHNSLDATKEKNRVLPKKAAKDQRPTIATKGSSRPATSTRPEGAKRTSNKRLSTARGLHRPRQLTSSRGPQVVKSKVVPVRPAAGVSVFTTTEETKLQSSMTSAERQVHCASKQNDLLPKCKMIGSARPTAAAEKTVADTIIVNKDAIEYCLKIRSVNGKISNLIMNPSNDILHAKAEFLQVAESSFVGEYNFPDGSLDPVSDEVNSVCKAVRSKLKDVSPVLQSLSPMRWEKIYAPSTEQMQQLCQKILKLQEIILELEGKELIFRWSLNLLQSDRLTKSEKVSAYRKFYGLLLANGKNLPAMIDDSETHEYEEGDS